MTVFIRIIFLGLVSILLTACPGGGGGGGGGGDGGGGNGGSSSSTSSSGGGPVTSLQLSLNQGTTWTFFWNTESTSFAQGSGTSSSSDFGQFQITLGASVLIGGRTAYPLAVTGDPGDFTPRWTHLAVSANGSLLGSTDGASLGTVYNAQTNSWMGGGFFIEFDSDEEIDLTSGTFSGEYNTTSSLIAGHSSSEGGCETILGEIICDDTSTDFSEQEFYKQGVGPIGYTLDVSYTSDGGGFFTSHTLDHTVELVATSLSAVGGYVFVPPPWEEVDSLNTARDAHSAVVLNNKIYVLGGGSNGTSLSSMEVYDPVTNNWTGGPAMPAGGLTSAEVIAGKIYASLGGASVYIFDPAAAGGVGSWSTVTPVGTPTSPAFGADTAVYNDAGFGNIVVGVSNATCLTHSMIAVAYDPPTGNQWLFGQSALSIGEVLSPGVAVLGNTLYVIGGFGSASIALSNRGAQSRVLEYNIATDAWNTLSPAPASMNTARDNLVTLTSNGRIYALGGNPVTCTSSCLSPVCTHGAPLRSAESYNPATNVWSNIPSMLRARKDFDAVVLGGKLYVIGGDNGEEEIANVERYTIP